MDPEGSNLCTFSVTEAPFEAQMDPKGFNVCTFSNTSEDSNIVVLESSADSIPDNSCETAHGFSVSSDVSQTPESEVSRAMPPDSSSAAQNMGARTPSLSVQTTASPHSVIQNIT